MFKHFNVLVSKYFHFEGFANCNERTCFSQTSFQENKGHFKSHHVQDNCLPVFSEVCLLPSYYQFSSVTQSCLTLQSQGLQHARLPCPSPTPGAFSNSCPSSWWCHPNISSSLAPSTPAFNLSQHQGLFQRVSSLHQVTKVLEFSFSISPSNEYLGLISFRMDWLDLLAVQGTLKSLL